MWVIRVNWGRFKTIHCFFCGGCWGGRSWLHSQDRKTKKNSYKVRKGFHTVSTCILHKLFMITLFISSFSLTHVLCCAPSLYECRMSRLWQARKVQEVRKQSEVASQKLKEKIYEKLDSAEENRQNQIKSIRLKLQEHVSTGYCSPPHPMYSCGDTPILIPNHY